MICVLAAVADVRRAGPKARASNTFAAAGGARTLKNVPPRQSNTRKIARDQRRHKKSGRPGSNRHDQLGRLGLYH